MKLTPDSKNRYTTTQDLTSTNTYKPNPTHKQLDADNGNTGSEPRGMTHFLTGHDLLMCLQRDLSSMLVPTLYRNLVNPPMTL